MTIPLNEQAVLDLAILTGMYGDNSAQTVCPVLTSFRDEAGLYVNQLQQALSAFDYPEVSRLSHSLKSMCGLIGACQLMALCQSVEQAARQGDQTMLGTSGQELTLIWPALLLQIQRSLQDYGHADA